MSNFSLTNNFKDYVEFVKNPNTKEVEKAFFEVDMSFDVVLKCIEISKDKILSNTDKYTIMFELFFSRDAYMYVSNINEIESKVNYVFENFVSDGEKSSGGGKKTMDYFQDAEYIYASFLQDYGIDLIEMQGKLHWKRFIALIASLSERTKLSEVIDIRTKEIPLPDKHNAKERRRIIELKRKYALVEDNPLDRIKSADEKLKSFSVGLKKK